MINELMKRLSELPNVTMDDGQEYIQLYDAMETVKRALEQEPTDENLHREREQAYMQGYEDASKRFRQEPSGDLINRQDAIKAIEEKAKRIKNEDTLNGLAGAVGILFDLPSVKPQEPTGHWVKTPKAVMGEGYMWYCDKCEHQVYQDSSKSYPSENYCPNCGAKMIER